MTDAQYQSTKLDLTVDAIADRIIRDAADPEVRLAATADAFRCLCEGVEALSRADQIAAETAPAPEAAPPGRPAQP